MTELSSQGKDVPWKLDRQVDAETHGSHGAETNAGAIPGRNSYTAMDELLGAWHGGVWEFKTSGGQSLGAVPTLSWVLCPGLPPHSHWGGWRRFPWGFWWRRWEANILKYAQSFVLFQLCSLYGRPGLKGICCNKALSDQGKGDLLTPAPIQSSCLKQREGKKKKDSETLLKGIPGTLAYHSTPIQTQGFKHKRKILPFPSTWPPS